MLSKCANPQCSARMKYMHDGSLYVVPKPTKDRYWTGVGGEFSAPRGKQIECFWLCDGCSRQLTISKNGELVCRTTSSLISEAAELKQAMQQKSDHSATEVDVLIADSRAGISIGETTLSAVN